MTELKDLRGSHVLTGCESTMIEMNRKYREPETVNALVFVLDGETYAAIEDPDDGYRSSLDEIRKGLDVCKNTFAPIDVFAILREKSGYDSCEILEIYDCKTGDMVMQVGTENTSDYYPSFVASFMPENMILNREKKS